MKFNMTSALESASRLANKLAFKTKKHSPEILIAVGAVSIVTGTVQACKATLKMQDVLETTSDNLEKIHGLEDGTLKVKEGETYTEEDARKDKTTVYIQTAAKAAKLYAPAVILIGGGLGCMIGSHIIMRRRYGAAVAAYSAVTTAFNEYKARVKERFGEQTQYELEHGVKAEEVETTDENGNKKKETVYVGDKMIKHPYSVVFDETNPYYERGAGYNLIFVKNVQDAANRKLRKKGYLFLNDVYDMLGVPNTYIGQFAGWVWDPANPKIDSYVDFGLYDEMNPQKVAFLQGDEYSVVLDFNVDGNIIDKVEGIEKRRQEIMGN